MVPRARARAFPLFVFAYVVCASIRAQHPRRNERAHRSVAAVDRGSDLEGLELLQRRVSSPLLVDGHAFDLGVYVFVDRRGSRRKLWNLGALVRQCQHWRGARIVCSSADFGGGLTERAVGDAILRTDVLVSPHGADLVNGFGLHDGASVVEVVPPYTKGCPCHIFQEL